MGNQISQQMLTFVQSILLGLAAGVLYDLLRPFRLRRPGLTALLDAGYCLSVGAGAFLFLLRRGEGELRGFLVLGAVGGAVLFFCAFSHLLQPIWEFWAETLAYLVHLLSIPLLWVKKICTKLGQRGKNLFYFTQKCYTMKRKPSHKGGGRGGKGPEKKKGQGSGKTADQAGHSGAAGGYRMAAVRPAEPSAALWWQKSSGRTPLWKPTSPRAPQMKSSRRLPGMSWAW